MILQRYFEVSQANDVGSFERHLVRFAHEMGFPLVTAALVIDRPGPRPQPVFMIVGNTPKGFYEASRNLDDAARDPVNKRLKGMSVPFAYDQALYVSEDAADLWETQAAFGYRTGICVPLHLPGYRHFLLGVDRDEPLPRQEERLTRLMADLQLLAVHAQSAACQLLMPLHEEAEPPKLTARELEILRWTMDGKSAWSVGEILGVSEHTVNFHLRNVFKKLDASSKHQAVLKAVGLGLL